MKRKLAVFGLVFAAAELAGAILPLPACWLAAAALLLGWLVLLFRPAVRAKVRQLLPAVLGAVAGLAWFTVFSLAAVMPVRALAGRTVTASATVEPGAEASYEDGMLRGTLRLEGIEGHAGGVLVRCTSFPAGEAGTCFRGEFSLAELPEDEYRLGRYADGIYLEAEWLGGYAAQPAKSAPRFWLNDLRQALRRRLYAWMPPLYAGLESAMLLGDRAGLDSEVYRSFQLAGGAHLLAVSGLHVTLLCGLLPFGTDRRRRAGTVLRMALVLFYMALTGFPVSVVRAGCAVLLAQAGRLLDQPPDALTALGAAALLLGVHNAYAPCDVGFQLSFCAVLGVLAAAALAKTERRALLRRLGGDELPTLWNAVLTVAEVVQIAAFASLATLPILILHSMAPSGAAVVTSLLVVWMLRPALLLGVAVLAFSLLPFLAPAMRMASLALTLWLRAMLALVRFCAALPVARLALPRNYTLWVLAVLGVLALVFWTRRKRTSMLWYLPAAVLCTAVAVGAGVWVQHDVLTLALVGTAGNPCAVLTQNGQAAVLYRGGAYNADAVAEYLAAHGGPALELLIDLRQQPSDVNLPAGQTLTVQDLSPRSDHAFGSGVTVTLYHQSAGNLAVVDGGGIRAAMLAGSPAFGTLAAVDVFLAGGAAPNCLAPDAILTNSRNLRWLDGETFTQIYYGETPAAVIRPGQSLTFEEAKPLAVQ